MANNISFYSRASDVKSQETIPLDIFFNNIRTGVWQDTVHAIRIIKDKAQRDEAKKRCPNVTISGVFTERYDKNIIQHSGFIGIDIDNCDPEQVKAMLSQDRYIVAAFASISGRGLCIIIKVRPEKHREAFQGFCEYLYNNYQLAADPTSINPSRARFVSYDPYIYEADKYDQFAIYPKQKEPKKIDRIVYTADDFSFILKQIVERRTNLAENYYEWLRCGFALVSKFGEQGREYFHIISQFSAKYDSDTCDKQYDACLKQSGNKETTISTLYYYAKEAGCEVYSERTKIIAHSAAQSKKGGLSPVDVEKNLSDFEGISGDDVADIIKQVYDQNIFLNEETLIAQLKMYLRQSYSLKRNDINRYIENREKQVDQVALNSIYLKAKEIMEKINYDLFDRVVHSDFVPNYNPIHDFFALATNQMQGDADFLPLADLKNGPWLPPAIIVDIVRRHYSCITALFDCITTKDNNYALYFGAKWLVGIISSAYGEHSPLMLVLTGNIQNTGKTEWFRRLLPPELKPYYAESKLDREKDDEILMTQRIIIMDDEMGGKSKKEIKRLKELTSKQVFTLREPYGRGNVDLVRMAVLCGTTNESDILSDPTGNRRIIPVHVNSIDQDKYNRIDKRKLMWEVYDLYKAGLRWRFTKDDIAYLNADTQEFEMLNLTGELIQQFFKPDGISKVTATQIKTYIEKHTQQRLTIDSIGKELKRLGFIQRIVRTDAGLKRLYDVTYISGENNDILIPEPDPDNLPF